MALRRSHKRICVSLEMIAQCNENLPCFGDNTNKMLNDFRDRFRANLPDDAVVEFVDELVDESLGNWRTYCYDKYQRCFGGIF